MTQLIRSVSFFILISILSILASINAIADDDHVSLIQWGEVGGEYVEEEVTTIYIGQTNVGLEIEFGSNCLSWSVELSDTPLFINEPSGTTIERVSAGTSNTFGLSLNDVAPTGDYNLTVYLNYTNEGGSEKSQMFEFTVEYIEVITFEDHYIDYYGRRFHAEFETIVHFEDIQISLGPSREIDLRRSEFTYKDVSAGTIHITSSIDRNEQVLQTEQTITYSITAVNGTHHVELGLRYEPIRIDLSNRTANDNGKDGNSGLLGEYSLGIILIIVLIVIAAAIYITRIREP